MRKEEKSLDIRYVVFRQKGSYGWVQNLELKEHGDVMVNKEIKGRVLNEVHRFHTAAKTNKYFQIPFQMLWFKYYLDEEKLDPKNKLIFLFEDGSVASYNPKYLSYIRCNYPKAYLVFAAFNSSFRYSKKKLRFIEDNYDYITSFDRKDCLNRGWGFYSGIYSKLSDLEPDGEYESDLYFVGADKGRLPLIYEVYDRMTALGLKCDFTVTGVKAQDIRSDTNITFNKWTDYKKVLKKACKARCLVDILQPGQDGATYRQNEAVVYGIKLITNYQNVYQERYYNPKQMQIFTKADDIDVSFIKDNYSHEDFPYNGCLAPYNRLLWLRDQLNI